MFEWGKNDCTSFVLDELKQITKCNSYPELTYKNKEEAIEFSRKFNWLEIIPKLHNTVITNDITDYSKSLSLLVDNSKDIQAVCIIKDNVLYNLTEHGLISVKIDKNFLKLLKIFNKNLKCLKLVDY